MKQRTLKVIDSAVVAFCDSGMKHSAYVSLAYRLLLIPGWPSARGLGWHKVATYTENYVAYLSCQIPRIVTFYTLAAKNLQQAQAPTRNVLIRTFNNGP